jgi:hypothetical protein
VQRLLLSGDQINEMPMLEMLWLEDLSGVYEEFFKKLLIFCLKFLIEKN